MGKRKKKILIVGAGFSGSVIARDLADSGYFSIDIIDQRDHVAGNCYDPFYVEHNLRIHKYGPHIFHTDDRETYDYLSRFTDWIPYRHRVEAYVEGVGHVPFPINLDTINKLYEKDFTHADQMKLFLKRLCKHHPKVKNARQAAENLYGKELVDLFFARYTKKMWGIDLDELPVSVVSRLPVRYDRNAGYFNDRYQAMPSDGYVSIFRNMLAHPDVRITLKTPFEHSMERNYDHIFNGMAIDEYYHYEYGPLPYRSIRHETIYRENHSQPVPTVNLTDTGPVTRHTDWRLYPGCGETNSRPMITYETPCSYLENNKERYYPTRTVDGEPQNRYDRYKNLSSKNKKNTFIGRCGLYRYLDMDQVVTISRDIARDFVSGN